MSGVAASPSSRTWAPAGIPYVVAPAQSYAVAGGGSLTIQAGTIVKFATCSPYNYGGIDVSSVSGVPASLTVNGTLDIR